MNLHNPILYISEVSDGHMGVSATANRKKFFKKLGIDQDKTVDIIVAHGDKIKIASEKDAGKFFEGYDAVITKTKGLTLGLTVADCIPISVFDPVGGSIALIHAGWRNLLNGIIGKTIKKIGNQKELLIYIGPHICKRHYEIKHDVSAKFNGEKFLDLGAIAKEQLLKAGIKGKNITIDSRCTFEDKELFSYRRGDLKNRNLYLLTLNEG